MCHAPSALLATRIHGESPFKGYRVTGFTNEEEAAVGLADKAQWLLEDELKEKIGVEFSRGPIWEPYTVEDHNLFTGQNPSSAAVLAQRLLTGRVLAGPVLDGLRHGSLRRCSEPGRDACRGSRIFTSPQVPGRAPVRRPCPVARGNLDDSNIPGSYCGTRDGGDRREEGNGAADRR